MYEYNVRTQVIGGDELTVKYAVKVDEPIITIPDVFAIGGGGPPHFDVQFSHDGTQYHWQGSAIPLVLQFHETSPYLVALDRQDGATGIDFAFFRYDATWQTITRKEFPKFLALQNLWSYEGASPETAKDVPYDIVQALKHNNKNLTVTQAPVVIDPASETFHDTLTAVLWVALEKDLSYSQAKAAHLPAQFYEDFFTQYFPTTVGK